MSQLNNERLKQVSFLLLLLLLGLLLFWRLYNFLPAFLGAVTLYILSRSFIRYLINKKRWKIIPAAILVMVLSFLIILLPAALLVQLLYAKIEYTVNHSGEVINGLKAIIDNIKNLTGFDLLSDNTLQKIQENAGLVVSRFLGATINVVSNLIICYFILYFLLVNTKKMEEALYEYIPLKETNIKKLGIEVKNMVISNAVGIPLLAVLQGIIAFCGYWIFGVQDRFLWTVITAFVSVLPLIGTAIIWIPMSIYLLTQGSTWQGIGLLLYGVLVITQVDNIFRFVLQKKMADVHPLITVFGVIIGVGLFGFVGLIFGPLLISLFILLLRIYSDEYLVKKREIKK